MPNDMLPVANDEKPKKKRRSALQKRKDALETTEEGRTTLAKALTEISVEFNQPKVMSDNQLRQRLNGYLNKCVKQGQYPTVEEGLLSTGYSKQYMLDISKGRVRGRYFTPEAAEIIARFVDICAALDAKLVMSDAVPQIPYIYRSKNYYGMSDKTEMQVTVDTNDDAGASVEDIAKRYAIETSFTEETVQNEGQNAEQTEE